METNAVSDLGKDITYSRLEYVTSFDLGLAGCQEESSTQDGNQQYHCYNIVATRCQTGFR